MTEVVYQDDMSKVSDSELMKEGWYRVRVSQVNPIVKLTLKVQSEGEFFGRSFPDQPSLQPQALFKLKAYYKATGYNPGPEGHNPHKLLDGECWVYVVPGQYQGSPTLDIKPYSIRSLQEGPGGAGGRKN
jgi:hypothetical protein